MMDVGGPLLIFDLLHYLLNSHVEKWISWRPELIKKPMETPKTRKKRKTDGNQNRDKEEGWRMSHLEAQGIPVWTPVSDVTVSGSSPPRCSQRPEYNK